MATIETPFLIVGPGPASLVAAKVASGAGLACMIVGHQAVEPCDPVELDEASLAILEPHGVLGVLRPYAASQQPFMIAPELFENGLKHHCVADMLITVYDNMTISDSTTTDSATTDSATTASGMTAVLTDGSSSWPVSADHFLDTRSLDTSTLPLELNEAIHAAADYSLRLLEQLRAAH